MPFWEFWMCACRCWDLKLFQSLVGFPIYCKNKSSVDDAKWYFERMVHLSVAFFIVLPASNCFLKTLAYIPMNTCKGHSPSSFILEGHPIKQQHPLRVIPRPSDCSPFLLSPLPLERASNLEEVNRAALSLGRQNKTPRFSSRQCCGKIRTLSTDANNFVSWKERATDCWPNFRTLSRGIYSRTDPNAKDTWISILTAAQKMNFTLPDLRVYVVSYAAILVIIDMSKPSTETLRQWVLTHYYAVQKGSNFRLPYWLVIGAQKAGTSALSNWLFPYALVAPLILRGVSPNSIEWSYNSSISTEGMVRDWAFMSGVSSFDPSIQGGAWKRWYLTVYVPTTQRHEKMLILPCINIKTGHSSSFFDVLFSMYYGVQNYFLFSLQNFTGLNDL